MTDLLILSRFDDQDIDAHALDTNLWQGAIPPQGPKLQQAGFQLLVLCAMEHQPAATEFPGIEVIHAPNDDTNLRHPTREELRIAVAAASRVVEALRNERKVLVTCWAGRNRSGLVSALALREYLGISGSAASAMVRMARPDSLTNSQFQACLDRLQAPRI
jgi:protein-tyrosine phosphatase